MGEKVAGTHISITMEGDRERFCEASEGFLITADCQETVMSVEAWTMVAGDLRSVRAGGIPHISSGKCLAASTGDFAPLLPRGYSLSHNLFISTVFFPKKFVAHFEIKFRKKLSKNAELVKCRTTWGC